MQRMTIATIGDEEQHVATISSTVHCYRLHLAVAVLGLILDCEGSTQVSDPVLHSQSTSYPLHSVLNLEFTGTLTAPFQCAISEPMWS